MACCALLAAGNASAAEEGGLRLSGFGTFGYVRDNRPDIAPARDIGQNPSNGFSTGPGWQLDSRIGVQLEYAVSPLIDLVGQAVWRDQFKADVDSSIDLAYVALKPGRNLDVRLGRINYDAFLMSDHRNVGYAYQWVRPPAEFYGWIPIFSLDGIDAAYTLRDGEAQWRFKAQAGNSRLRIPIGNGYDFHAHNMLGTSVSRQSGSWRLKAAYSQFDSANEVPAFAALHQGLDQVVAANLPSTSAEAADLRRNLAFKNAKISYTTLGAAYDDGVWLGQAELGRSTATAAVIPHGTMAYASIGRRFGTWTPSLTLSASRPGNRLRAAANSWGAFNATVRDPALFTLNATRIEQNTLSLAARWDFRSNAALKLQWERTVIKPSGYGLWWRDTAINMQTSRINQVSATVDFTF
ncbi:MAG: hypothetical protein A3H93_20315 [Rhodocyclales bacterium RIFCSPLOWO2_02_FULL_63_24]|nr:MAG: hypothetical protein A3H93_20315 [Rhodocyclales bacterium RIFCSPLOWO2_02_FULL_63_24]